MTTPALPPELGYGGKRPHTAHNATFDLAELLASRLLVQGVSGSGKSHLIRSMLEMTHGAIQHLIIDREGEFVTLREKFPYLIVGKGGDVPATPQAAGLLVRRIMELGVSTIIDLSELKKPEQREYVKRAFEELMGLPHSLQHPLLVVLDEGEVFAPEGEKSMALEAVVDVACRGRKRDFCLVVATTRLSKLNKDCSAELLNKLIGYTDDVDLQRAAEQLGMTREQRATLKRLPRGHFWAYGPAISRDPLLVRSQDTLTKRPERGQLRKPTPPAPKAIAALLSQLKDLPAEAAQEAKTVADLQRQVAERDRKIRELERSKPKAPEAKVEIRTKEVPVDRPVPFVPPEYSEVVSAAENLNKAMGLFAKAAKKAPLRPTIATPSASTSRAGIGSTSVVQPGGTPRKVVVSLDGPKKPWREVTSITEISDLSKGQRVVLKAIAQHTDGATRDQLTVLTGYKRSSRDTYLQQLKQGGYIGFEGETILATEAGIDALGADFEPLPTGAALREHWLRELGNGGEKKILEFLVEAYPEAIERADLDEPTGYKRSSRDTYLQKLISRKLVQVVGRSQVKASALLFDGGN